MCIRDRYITDNGNFILDVDFGAVDEPAELEMRLKGIPGVIETGLFLGMAQEAIVGTRDGIKVIRRT